MKFECQNSHSRPSFSSIEVKDTPFLHWYQKNSNQVQKNLFLHPLEKIDSKAIINSFRTSDSLKTNPQIISQYTHEKEWKNRLIYGDSTEVMQSFLRHECKKDFVKMFYFDPPYGVGYNANFQLRNSILREKGTGKITKSTATIRAFEDTWKYGIHSYLQYIYDNLLLAKELLCAQGSIFLQIGDENVANVSKILDEIFGAKNKISLISIKKTSGFGASGINNVCDYILWYAKDKKNFQAKKLFCKQDLSLSEILKTYNLVREKNGSLQKILCKKNFVLEKGQTLARCECIHSEGETSTGSFPVEFNGEIYYPPRGRHWTTHQAGIKKLMQLNRVSTAGQQLAYVRYWDDFPYKVLTNLWDDVSSGFGKKEYAVQTSMKCIQRCILLSTDPGDVVMDITCGGGTTPVVAEQWGRKWIAVDTSPVAIHVTTRRLIYKLYPHYKRLQKEQDVSQDFIYKSFSHVTIKSLANDIACSKENLYDVPLQDKDKTRATSIFQVESFLQEGRDSVFSVEELCHWRKDVIQKGIVGVSGKNIQISSLQQDVCTTQWIGWIGNTNCNKKLCFVFNFDVRKTGIKEIFVAIKADFFIFCGVENDFLTVSEVRKYQNALLMSVQRGWSDQYLLTPKTAASWLLGDPMVSLIKESDLYKVKIDGFRGIDEKFERVDTYGLNRVMMWMVDTNYDGKFFSPNQSFIPTDCNESWIKFFTEKKSDFTENIQNGIHRGGVSLLFPSNLDSGVAIKVIDDRGRKMLQHFSF